MDLLEKYVWMPDEEEAWIGCKISGVSEDGSITTLTPEYFSNPNPGNLKTFKKPSSEVMNYPAAQESTIRDDYSNLINLEEFTEGAVLHQLRSRYFKDKIYSEIGAILIAINPFKMMPIYNQKILNYYKTRSTDAEKEPHIFQTASRTYWDFMVDRKNQSMIISGESGSGKTETTKLMLQFISDIAGGKSGIEQRILASNPILEAFGNAKTLRNDNSSRFGKWMEVMFDKSCKIVGAKIVNYLLEKSRVVTQNSGERNYHIFYQLLAGASMQTRMDLKLRNPSEYFYLNRSSCLEIEGVSDMDMFSLTQKSFEELRFSSDEIEQIWTLVSSILQIGNLTFTSDGSDGSEVADISILKDVCSVLKVSPKLVEDSLCFRQVTIRNEVQKIKQDPEHASNARDSLAKTLYEYLFEWLVSKCNLHLSEAQTGNVIGVLDIFGFEVFEINSFEQFCINLANEKLQQHFNHHIFRMEQEEYAVEGLNLDSIPFVDNQGCLEMIEGSFGILKMLDEEAMLPRGSDLALIEKMHKRFHDDNQNDYYDIKKIQKELFIVIHYAGPVPYLVSGFVEKNKDNVHESLTEAMKTSHVELIQIIFANAEKDITTVETCGKKRKTIASKFSHQLRSLMESLYNTSPHFVRCIKPNQAKKPGIIDAKLTLRQMKYAGLFEAIRVRASGYAYRKPLKSFFNRYKTILDKQSTAKVLKTGDFNLGCSNIINCLIDRKISLNDIQIGKTKVFYRASVFTLLENSRDGKLEARVLMMQCLTRRMLARKLLKKIKELLRLAKKSIVLNDIAKMEEVLSLSLEIPIILGIVGTVKEKLSIAKEEIRITRLIESAIETEDIDRLQGAIEQALKLNSNRREFLDFVQKANERTSQFKDVEDCKRNIQFAMDNEDLNLLMNAIAKAKELKLPQQIYNSAETALKRMEREDIIFKTLEEIMSRFSSGNADIIELERAFHPAKRITLNKLRVKLVQKAADLIVDFYNESISQKIEEKNALALKEIIDHLETSKLSSLVRNSILQASNFLRNYIGEQLPDAPADDYFTSPPPIPETYVSKKSTKEKQSSRLLNRLKKAMDLLDINKIKLYLDTYKKLGLETTPLIVLAKKIVFGMSEVEQWTLKFNRFIDDKKDVKLVRRLLKKAIEKNHPVEEDLNKARRFLVLEASHHQSHMRRISSSYVSEGQCDLTKLFHTFKGLYSFADLNILRTPENYVKKNFFHRRYLMNKMLIWQDEPILRSLIRFSLEQCNDSHVKYRQIKRRAVEMFKDVMGFMGDTHSSFSITLALDLLKTCQEEPILCDELYCQIIKQTSRNPSVESLLLGWKLMYLCLNVFNPKNADLENVIRSHIVDIANPKVQKYMPFDTVQNVASNCWLALRKSKETQYRNRPLPTIEEIRALTETKPMIMKLYLDEKEFIEFPISASRSDITVHKICELVYNHMNQKSAASGELANGLTGFTQNSGGAGPRGRRESVEEIPSLGLIGRIVIQKVNKKQSDVAILEVDPYESMVLIISTLEGQRNADPEMEYHFQYLKESRPILGQSSIVDITDDEEQDDDEDDDEVEDPHIQITRHSSRVTSPIWEDPFLME